MVHIKAMAQKRGDMTKTIVKFSIEYDRTYLDRARYSYHCKVRCKDKKTTATAVISLFTLSSVVLAGIIITTLLADIGPVITTIVIAVSALACVAVIISNYYGIPRTIDYYSPAVGHYRQEEVNTDTYFKTAFPDLYPNMSFYKPNDLEQRIHLLISDKEYGEVFTNLFIGVLEAKATMPRQDRQEIEKSAGRTTRRFYDLIVAGKLENLTTQSDSLEAMLLGYEELLKGK